MTFGHELRALWPGLEDGAPAALHAARKLSRRAQAALRVDGGHAGARRAWQDLRRALAPLRDHDVAGARLRAELVRLGAPARGLARFERLWRQDREAQLRRFQLPEQPSHHQPVKDHHKRARRRLEGDWQRLTAEAATDLASADEARWHALRKRLKTLRYTWELLEPPPAPLLEALDLLGAVQDATITLQALGHPAVARRWRPALDAALRRARTEAQDQARVLWSSLASLQPPGFRPG